MIKPSRIAVNIMVKNARESILNALASVTAYVDEIVVFDTGSTDGTQEAVQNYLSDLPAHVKHTFREVPWVDNFSTIRNQMLEATTSDWVLALDSDEVLTISGGTLSDLAQSGHKAFFIEKRSYVRSKSPDGFKPLKGEHPEQEKTYTGYISEPNYLFFEKDSRVHYERCVHETIEFSLMRANIHAVRTNEAIIHNHGRHDMSVKGPWYASLIKKLSAESPDDGLAWCYRGVQEKIEGNLHYAIECFDRSIHLIPNFASPMLSKAECLSLLGQYVEAERLLTDLSYSHPNEEVVWLQLVNVSSLSPTGASMVTHHVARSEAANACTPAIYEAAAATLVKMKKQVKADIFRKRARELKRHQGRG